MYTTEVLRYFTPSEIRLLLRCHYRDNKYDEKRGNLQCTNKIQMCLMNLSLELFNWQEFTDIGCTLQMLLKTKM